MTKVYTRIDGKLAKYIAETYDPVQAIDAVRKELGIKHKSTILAVVTTEPIIDYQI